MRDEEDWRFDENPTDSEYDSGGVGQWNPQSRRKLNIGENTMTIANPTKDKKQMLPTEVLTPEFRVSYPYVFEPRKAEGNQGKAKYSVQMWFRIAPDQANPHEKVVDITALKEACLAAGIEKWGQDRAKWPKNLHSPFRDGAEKEEIGAGVVFVNATSEFKPGVVDQNVNDIVDRNQFYPGCYARAKIAAYGWEYMGKTGISFGLRHLQLIRDGEPLGGGTSPKDDFQAIPLPGGGAPAPAGAAAGTPAKDPLFGGLV